MTKRNNIIYWIATAWLALGMISTGLVQVFKTTGEVPFITNLGYPGYFLKLLGAWKILGVVVLLIPRFPLLKEWAYAGFFFTMSGAIFSHIAAGDPVSEIFPSLWLLILTLVSWWFRPVDRKMSFAPSR
ncbi:DoxX family protein [Flavihumibacter solisilvae]|uniref:DoxX-like family protein n=1 Tax=Flavihumibacter solisilvae TaxID=1349421 RepID=A0A0C1LJ47_9BACT|nr:DoxX family protein [Flavihumibacter solisilvae]KIC95423.1 DoxX-like family protein [Flavihumibacter solisilvae]